MTNKRVLFVTSSAPQSAGDSTATFILSMARDLADLGYEIDILAPHAPNIAKHERIDGINFYRFRYFWPEKWQKLSQNGSAMVNLRKNKANMLLIPFFVAAQAIALCKLMRRHRYHIIHSHWILPQGLVAGLLARLFNTPHILMAHGADLFSLKHPVFVWLKRAALKHSTHVITNSHYSLSKLNALYTHPHSSIIPTGSTPCTDDVTSPLKRADYADENTKLIAFLGRIVEEKGLQHAIKALQYMPANTKLLVLGDGVDKAVCKRLTTSLKLNDRVIFAGAIAHENIYHYLQLCDAFVAPSVCMPSGWVEAQGNSIIEAMFARLPVVASDIGGIPDAVIDEHTGLLVPHSTPQAIATALNRLLQDEALCQTLTQNAKAHALAHFSRYKSAQKIAAIYEKTTLPLEH